LWDLEAKISGKRVWELANIPIVPEVETSFTISLDTPEKMAAAARANANAPILKLKLGGNDVDLARVEAVRDAAPAARLLIDANESWSVEHYHKIVPALKELGVELIEQPFPADADEVLETLDHPVPVCADESCHTTVDLPLLKNRYEVVNVKLDKTGGLTEALRLCECACESGFKLLIGCMVCTSLGIAPARLLVYPPWPADYIAKTAEPGSYLKTKDAPVPFAAQQAAGRPSHLNQLAALSGTTWVDLDGPLLLDGDREQPVSYDNGRIGIPSRELWG
jgi:L-alanine-DL-glutamate epimerase-like enolase superfamily enzyme